MKRDLPTIIGVIVAVVIAWFLVDAVMHLAWMLWKLVIVAVVAAIVYGVMRMLLGRSKS